MASPAESSSSNSIKEEENIDPSFLIIDPKKGSTVEILKSLVKKNVTDGLTFMKSSDSKGELLIEGEPVKHQWWRILLSFIICKIVWLFAKPMQYSGYVVEFVLNLISQNGGCFGIIFNFFRGTLKIPKRGTENFLSLFGQVDPRIELYKTTILSERLDNQIATDVANIKNDLGNKYLMDLCSMAAKFAYENQAVVENTVNNYWKMNFVAFYDCWNENQQQSNTQVFIFTDRPKDANLIVVSFRGTEGFVAGDVCTDFDFSWFGIPKVGKVHVGFLEALGLGNRSDPTSFHSHLQKHQTDFFHMEGESEAQVKDFAKKRAYYAVALTLKNLLTEHPNSKFVVTGHSLGAALAILFPSVLVIQEETEMLKRLLNVYTFGQPRIGDAKFGSFIEAYLNYPATRYYRVVYSYDMIPRIPFDDKLFAFKHFGTCVYYDSCYFGKIIEEEPNKNYFSLLYMIPVFWTAQWELLRSMMIGFVCGPQYKETWVMTLFRITGLVAPMVPSHSPLEYINSVRLGREKSVRSTSLKSLVTESSV